MNTPTNDIPKTYIAGRPKQPADRAKSTGQVIWDAVVDLYNQEQVVTRQTLQEVTGYKVGLIDDHIKSMIEAEQVKRVKDGVFVPVPRYSPPRPITGSMTTDGFFVLEVGDVVLVLQPKEARMAGALLAGQFAQFANIQSGQDTSHMVNIIWNELKALKRSLGEQ